MGNSNSNNRRATQSGGESRQPYAPTVFVPQTQTPAGLQGLNYARPGAYPPSRNGYPLPTGPLNQPKTQEYQRTATIRNQVNLRKPSLHLEPTNGSMQLLSIAFTFDASAPCRVTTFVHAREDSSKNCKISVQGNPAPPVYFEKGLEQRFPPAQSPNAPPQHCVNLGKHYLSDLCYFTPPPPGVTSRTYPLIIRLEALTDEGRAEQRSLEELKPGCELPHWVQSQATYAKLVKDDDGSIGIRVLEQKIWVKGESYELQEIYGMENREGNAGTSAAPRNDGFEDVEGNECVICMSAPRNTAAIPCRHMSMCHDCASALKSQSNKCPICRKEIDSFLHIKLKWREMQSPAGKQ